MSLTLTLNGNTAPTTFTVGGVYPLYFLVDGAVPLAVEWEYGLRYGPRISGTGPVLFDPVQTEPYYLHAKATDAAGVVQDAIFILSCTATGTSAASVSVHWSDPAPASAGVNSATIVVSSPVAPHAVAWAHYLNGVELNTGHGFSAPLGLLQPGIHRLFVTVRDHQGNTAVGDSSIHVPTSFGLQTAVTPPQPVDYSSSLIYLGSVYSPILEGDASLATSLPYILANFESSVKLIPGSTHFVCELDTVYSLVDGDVVVRTQLGNWTLIGPPNGITTDSLPYDYKHGHPFQPAPFDLSARYAVDVWNVQSLNSGAFKFRVRFRCFQSSSPIYRYTPCDWSGYAGGSGERQRRLFALVTNIDFALDAETPQNRGDSRNVETYTVPEQQFIIGNMETTGQPDRPTHDDDRFYTDQNTAGIYESVNGLKDIRARCTYGFASQRPAVLDFSQPGKPRIVNKPKRLWGKLLIYMAGGAFNRNTLVTVRIRTGAMPKYVDIPVTIAKDVYNPEYIGFVKAGEATIDISDFEFSRLGLTMSFTVDESFADTQAVVIQPATPDFDSGGLLFYTGLTPGATYYWNPGTNASQLESGGAIINAAGAFVPEFSGALVTGNASTTYDGVLTSSAISGTATFVDPLEGAESGFYYTSVSARAIKVDSACFRDPVLVPVFDGTFLGTATPISDCNMLACGPVGTYCYQEMSSGTGTYLALQPLGYPAPFIAPYGAEAHCYNSPSFMGEYLGGATVASSTVVSYSGDAGCGKVYSYSPCGTSLQLRQLAVIFPYGASPHAAVSYQGYCYALSGTISAIGTLTPVAVGSTSPVAGCTDVACTGSNPGGGSLDYIDAETHQQVTVSFPHLTNSNPPYFAAAPEASSQGYGLTPPGHVNWTVWNTAPIPVLTATETANLEIAITPSNVWREIVVNRGSQRMHYRFYPGLAHGTIAVQAGDTLTLEFTQFAHQYRGLTGQVHWYKIIPLPHLYDSATLSFSPSTGTLTALGFCGLSTRQDYCFYGTLGGSHNEMDLPNPDCVVTVKDSSSLPEMVVVRTKQPHEADFRFEMPSYQSQQLQSPITFNFYAVRSRAGAHGEMDVWLSRTGTPFAPGFPQYLKVSRFKSLVLADNAYRKMTQQTDTSRRGLRVISSTEAAALRSPRIFVDSQGQNIAAMTDAGNDVVVLNEDTFQFTGLYDTGISELTYQLSGTS